MRIEWREAVEHVVGNQSPTDRDTISRLWDILDDPHLEPSLRAPAELPHNVRTIPEETLIPRRQRNDSCRVLCSHLRKP